MEHIYFDNAASTCVLNESAAKVMETMSVNYGNPSSEHQMGNDAQRIVHASAKSVAALLSVTHNHIYFTSGATESNNWAILGAAKSMHRKGCHIITAKTEHPSVLEPINELKQQGFEVSYIDVKKDGSISASSLSRVLRPDTILVSLMHVNNEYGAINDIKSIGQMIKDNCNYALFHVDGAASFGKIPLSPSLCHIDLLTVSGHKIHGPKGVGALYIKPDVTINPLILGGSQQRAQRSGTENVPAIAGFGAALDTLRPSIKQHHEHVMALKKHFWQGLQHAINEAVIIGSFENASPYILNVGFKGLKSAVIMSALEEKGVIVSAGSACHSLRKKESTSDTLKVLSLPGSITDGSIRFSFSHLNTMAEIAYCLEQLKKIIPKLKSIM